ncbi:hypothetical protein CDD83_2581 [Cordyceps sp. RAO-2017]|nr:hypothetical protein CDD83_2581 [Cordyceps sp. RAO-2017]
MPRNRAGRECDERHLLAPARDRPLPEEPIRRLQSRSATAAPLSPPVFPHHRHTPSSRARRVVHAAAAAAAASARTVSATEQGLRTVPHPDRRRS